MPPIRPFTRLGALDGAFSAAPSLAYAIEPLAGFVRVDLFEPIDAPQLAHAFDAILRDPGPGGRAERTLEFGAGRSYPCSLDASLHNSEYRRAVICSLRMLPRRGHCR
jgi:hypothetical protein